MEIWNSKSNSSIYFKFELKYRALLEVNFGKTIYNFKY